MILPVFNGMRYVEESIDSVLQQSLDDFEFVICDDASTDGTRDLLGKYSGYPSVRILFNERNMGLFPTLNLLLRASRAPIIRLWSQDDVMKPGCLRAELDFWRDNSEIGFSYTRCDYIDKDGNCIRPGLPDWVPAVTNSWDLGQLFIYHGCLPGNIATVSIRRSVLDAIGPFRENLKVAGDYDMWVRISESYAMGCLQDPQVQIRIHDEQFSRADGSLFSFVIESIDILESILQRYPRETRSRLKWFLRRNTYSNFFHHSLKLLLRGRLNECISSWKELSKTGSVVVIALLWLCTANGRFFSGSREVMR